MYFEVNKNTTANLPTIITDPCLPSFRCHFYTLKRKYRKYLNYILIYHFLAVIRMNPDLIYHFLATIRMDPDLIYHFLAVIRMNPDLILWFCPIKTSYLETLGKNSHTYFFSFFMILFLLKQSNTSLLGWQKNLAKPKIL